MEMVAASKMKKAQETALQSKPYSEKVLQIVQALAAKTDPKLHPLLKKPKQLKRILLILITTNKGLCGSLNTNLFRTLDKFLSQEKYQTITIDFITLGRKGQSFVTKTRWDYAGDFSDTTPPTASVGPISQILTQGFLQGKYSEVWLIYNDFVNALVQKPFLKRVLPITTLKEKVEKVEKKDTLEVQEYLLEPSAREILDFLLPFYLEIQVRDAILEAEASEHSARMIAMKNATENALDLMAGLTLEYNKARQAQITSEIADIITAKESMEKK